MPPLGPLPLTSARLPWLGGRHLGVPRAAPAVSPGTGRCWHRTRAVSAATLPCYVASWHHVGGGIFLIKLGHDSQQWLCHSRDLGETWGQGAARPSPGQTSAGARPWATHKHKGLGKQTARCLWVFPLLVLCSRSGACRAVPDAPTREAVPLAAGGHSGSLPGCWGSAALPRCCPAARRLRVKPFAAADTALPQTAPATLSAPQK